MKMNSVAGYVILCLCVISQARELSGMSEEPTASDLAALAPVFSLHDPKLQSFRFGGYLAPSDRVAFDVAFERPNHFSVVVTDLDDGTPYFVAVDGHLLLYDALNRRAIVGEPGGIGFVARHSTEKGVNIHWVFAARADSADIDLKSFFPDLGDFRATAGKKGVYTLTATAADGTVVTSRIDLGKSCPYTRMEFTQKGESRAWISFGRIAANEEIAPAVWSFPSEEVLAKSLPVVKYTDWFKGKEKTDWSPVYSSLVRSAFRVPILREKLEERLGKLDWERLKVEDAKSSAALRDIIRAVRASPTSRAVERPGEQRHPWAKW